MRTQLVVAVMYALVVASTLVGSVALMQVGPPPSEAYTPAHKIVIAGRASIEANTAAELSLTWSTGRSSRTGVGAEGIITEVIVEPDAAVSQGHPLVAIDGRTVVAHVGQSPFHRRLARGDRGPDVERLRFFLQDVLSNGPSSDVTEPELFGSELQAAVLEFNELFGGDSPEFDPSTVVWVGAAEPWTATEPVVEEGARVAGSEVLFEPGLALQAAELKLLASLPATDAPFVLDVGGETVAFDSTSFPSKADLRRIEFAVLAGVEVLPITISYRTPRVVSSAPSSAIATTRSGEHCVVPADGTGPVAVDIVSGEFGTTFFVPPVADGLRLQVPTDGQC